MVDTKKEQEREELHRAIWVIADELRGAVDGWDFKNYVLGTMFYRYISENLESYINHGEWEVGNTDFRYAEMPDAEAEEARADLVDEKGFFILPSELFCNVRKAAPQDENLNETLEKIFRHIEESAKGSESEGSFAGLFDDYDVNNNKLGATVAKRNEKLVKLLDGIAAMDLGDVKSHDIDAFGDAYEYLMTMYASNAGKSGGEFFTPADVSELLTRLGTVGKTEINKVYDPACGSGSLLLKAEKVLGREAIRNGFFGQEINITTYNLCRINMHLHDVGYDKFDIACEDTLTAPQHWDDEPFELIVSNPPYSIKWAGDDDPILINDPRFSPAGVLAPKSKADMAFIMHSLSWLAPSGTAAIVCFPGIMYRGGAEQKIRKYLIDKNFIDCIIQLPANLFFGTTIATCIMVLKRGKTDNKTLFIDASGECIKVTNNNKLTAKNIERIVSVFAAREKEIKHFSYLADYEDIVENGYNLSVSTYVEAEDTREKIDIVKLNAEIEEIVAREQVLRDKIARIATKTEKGYKHYQEELLDGTNEKIRFVPIAELGKWSGGKTPSMAEPSYWDNGTIPWISSKDMKAATLLNTQDHITEKAVRDASMTVYPPNGIAIVTRSGILKHTLPVSYVPFETTINQDIKMLIVREDVLPRYAFHIIRGRGKDILAKAKKQGGTVDSLDFQKVLAYKVPLPSLDIQEQLVNALDNFDAICSDLNIGLSAEIEARQKQYEYYRDWLLTFKEVSV